MIPSYQAATKAGDDGRQTADQARLFYEFHLDERVPADHLLRCIGVLTAAALVDLRLELADHNGHTGRPSIDPELVIRMRIVCPGGKHLRTTGTVFNDNLMLCRGPSADWRSCPLKARCCPREPLRKIPRSIYEAAREVALSLFGTEGYARSRRDRKKFERQFAHLKRILRLRGPCGARDEFLLAAAPQNLRKLASLLVRPPPLDCARFAAQ